MIEQGHKGHHFARPAFDWWSRAANRRLAIRLAWLAVLLPLVYSLDWAFPRILLRDLAAITLELLGHRAIPLDTKLEALLSVDGTLYAVTVNCTYILLFFMIAPFWWRFEKNLPTNLLRLAFLAMIVGLINWSRIVSALHFNLTGVAWETAHTIPDISIHFIFLSVSLLLALRSDRKPAKL